MKKVISIFILINILFIFSTFPVFSYEEDVADDSETIALIESLEVSSGSTNSPDVNSTHIIALDRNTRKNFI